VTPTADPEGPRQQGDSLREAQAVSPSAAQGPAAGSPPGGPDQPDAPAAAPRPRGRRQAFAARVPALASRDYRRFFGGTFVGNVGSWMQITALGWLVLGLTNSPAALGLVSAIQTAPILFFSIFAGVIADRVDRRRLLVSMQVAAAATALALAVLTTAGVIAFWHVAVIALVAGMITAFQTPAYQAVVSTLVSREAIGSAVALNSAQYSLARVLGPALAGAVIAAGGIQLAFWGNTFALLLVAVVVATLKLASQPQLVRAEATLWANLMDGIRYVQRDATMRVLVLLAAVPALFLLNYLVLMPVYARDVLQIGAPGLGLLTGSIGVGAVVGAVGLALLRPSGGSGRGMLLGLGIAGIALVVFATSRSVPLSAAALAVLGACQLIYYATTNTLIQVLVPPRLRGRVISLYILTSWGVMPIGHLTAGAVAEHLGPTVALAGGGVITLLAVAGVVLAFPAVRDLRADRVSLAPADDPAPA
jgi:MFS family permease